MITLIFVIVLIFGLSFNNIKFFQYLVSFIYKWIFSAKINIISSVILSDRNLVLCNHPSYWDWILLLTILKHKTCYFIMNNKTRDIPWVGKIISNHHICLDKIDDISVIKQRMDDITKNPEYTIIIFPEGTNMCQNTLNKSLQYCNENNIDNFKKLLCPKYKGLEILLFYPFDKIIDATIFYPVKYHNVDYSGSMISFIKDEILTKSCVSFKNITPIFSNPLKVKEFLFQLWRKKDQEIKKLYLDYKKDQIKYNLKNRRVILYLNNILGISVLLSCFTDGWQVFIPGLMTFLSSKWHWNEFRPAYFKRYKLWDIFCCILLFISIWNNGGELLVKLSIAGILCFISTNIFGKLYGNYTIIPITLHIVMYQLTITSYILTRIKYFIPNENIPQI